MHMPHVCHAPALQRLHIHTRGLLAAHAALLAELAPLARLHKLIIQDSETQLPASNSALASALTGICCSCSSLERLTVVVGGGELDFDIDVPAWHDGVERALTALALLGRAGVQIELVAACAGMWRIQNRGEILTKKIKVG